MEEPQFLNDITKALKIEKEVFLGLMDLFHDKGYL